MERKIELLAPAGDLEKLKIAVDYGADAVYFGGEAFGLRAAARNFTISEIEKGVCYAHDHGSKAYMTLNILAHNQDLPQLETYLEKIADIEIDAFIVSDPGVIDILKKTRPHTALHLSTQASTANYRSAAFWHEQGIKRIVLARELSLAEIAQVREKAPESLELEAFVHGAMCISHSGRCLLSNVMVQRDANQGACAHPCRWNYVLMEEKRPGEYMPVWEDERGTYIMNAKDLCMIRHIPKIAEAGITSVKIEGRMKSVFYVAVIVGAYRKAIDAYYENGKSYRFDEEWMCEAEKAGNRGFTSGFYFHPPDGNDQNYTSSHSRAYTFCGMIKCYDEASQIAVVEQRNKMVIGDQIEVFGPGTDYFKQVITYMTDEQDDPIEAAPHAQQIIKIKMDQPVGHNFMIRKPCD